MFKIIVNFVGIGMVAVGAYIAGYKEGEKVVNRETFEKGMQIGFKTAPDIYREMAKNGDIEKVPEGMYMGEIGKVFKTLDDAREARLKHQLATGFRNNEKIFFIEGKGKFGELYILANEDHMRKG